MDFAGITSELELAQHIVNTACFHRVYETSLFEITMQVAYGGDVYDVKVPCLDYETLRTERERKWLVASKVAERLWPKFKLEQRRQIEAYNYERDRFSIWGPKED